MTDAPPSLVIIAGPNGSGKSTFTRAGLANEIPVVDPDAIAKTLPPAAAARLALQQQEAFLRRAESFAIETTLAGNRTLKLIEAAKGRGYAIDLHYVRLESAELNVLRVAERVSGGGHDVPREDVIRRFDRSTANLPKAIALSDLAVLYDNSGREAYKVATLSSDAYRFASDMPAWATHAAMESARIAARNAETEADADNAASRYLEAAVFAGAFTADALADLTRSLGDERLRASGLEATKDTEGEDLTARRGLSADNSDDPLAAAGIKTVGDAQAFAAAAIKEIEDRLAGMEGAEKEAFAAESAHLLQGLRGLLPAQERGAEIDSGEDAEARPSGRGRAREG